jgi:hypothetical protein
MAGEPLLECTTVTPLLAAGLFLGVRLNLVQPVGVAFDLEVAAPGAGDADLPKIFGLVVLLGA